MNQWWRGKYLWKYWCCATLLFRLFVFFFFTHAQFLPHPCIIFAFVWWWNVTRCRVQTNDWQLGIPQKKCTAFWGRKKTKRNVICKYAGSWDGFDPFGKTLRFDWWKMRADGIFVCSLYAKHIRQRLWKWVLKAQVLRSCWKLKRVKGKLSGN